MTLELRKREDGSLRPYWYGRFKVDGKRICVKLDTPLTGNPPPDGSLKCEGNAAFERSRAKAEAELQHRINEARSKQSATHWAERIYELKFGEEAPRSLAIKDLVRAWDRMPKRKPSSELHPRYIKAVHATFRRFNDFIQAEYPNITIADQVTPHVASEFMAKEESRGMTAKSRNDTLKRLRAVFRYAQNEYGLARNPFAGIKSHRENHTHRRPLTEEEITALLEALKDDDFTRPLVVCALSTALRRGDCCALKWEAVHLAEQDRNGNMLPDHITVLTSKTGEVIAAPVNEMLRQELDLAAATRTDSPYVWPDAAAHPNGVTWRLGLAFKKAGIKERHQERKRGMRRASVVDFHSLRTTWITDKLSKGIPIEVVKRTSGQRTTEIVTEHYYHPDIKQHLASLGSEINGASKLDEVRQLVKKMKPAKIRDQVLNLLDEV